MAYSPIDQFWADHPALKARKKRTGWYTVLYAPLGANKNQLQQDVQTSTSFDFLAWCASLIVLDVNDANFLDIPCRISILNQGNSQDVNNVKQGIGSLLNSTSSTVPAPAALWPAPLFYPGGSNISTALDNPTGTPCNVYVTFTGVKIY